MFRAGFVLTAFASLTAMAGCASQAQTVGAATGAAIGAAMGGGTIATVGGAMVGYGAGRAYDERHNR